MDDRMKKFKRELERSKKLDTYEAMIPSVDEYTKVYAAYVGSKINKIRITSADFPADFPHHILNSYIHKVHDAIKSTDKALYAIVRGDEGMDQDQIQLDGVNLIYSAYYIQARQWSISDAWIFRNFHDRMIAILEALETSKALCQNICDPIQPWCWRIAASPKQVLHELHTIQGNEQLDVNFESPIDDLQLLSTAHNNSGSGEIEETAPMDLDSNAIPGTCPQLGSRSETDATQLGGGQDAVLLAFYRVDQQAQRADRQQPEEEHTGADCSQAEAASDDDCISVDTSAAGDCIMVCPYPPDSVHSCPSPPDSDRSSSTITQQPRSPKSISVSPSQMVEQSQGDGADVPVPESCADTDLGQCSDLRDDLTPADPAEKYTGDAMDSPVSGALNDKRNLGSLDHTDAMSIDPYRHELEPFEQDMADFLLEDPMHEPHDGEIPSPFPECATTAMAPGGTFGDFEDSYKMILEARSPELKPLEEDTANTLHLDDDMMCGAYLGDLPGMFSPDESRSTF